MRNLEEPKLRTHVDPRSEERTKLVSQQPRIVLEGTVEEVTIIEVKHIQKYLS